MHEAWKTGLSVAVLVAILVYLLIMAVPVSAVRSAWSFLRTSKEARAATIALSTAILAGVTVYTALVSADYWAAFWSNALSSLITGAVVSVSLGWYVSKRVADYQQGEQLKSASQAARYEITQFKEVIRGLFVKKTYAAYAPPEKLEPEYVAEIVARMQDRPLGEWEGKVPEAQELIDCLRSLQAMHYTFQQRAGECGIGLDRVLERAEEEQEQLEEEKRQRNPFRPPRLSASSSGSSGAERLRRLGYILARELHPDDPAIAEDEYDKKYGIGEDAFWFATYKRDAPAQEATAACLAALHEVRRHGETLRRLVETEEPMAA